MCEDIPFDIENRPTEKNKTEEIGILSVFSSTS